MERVVSSGRIGKSIAKIAGVLVNLSMELLPDIRQAAGWGLAGVDARGIGHAIALELARQGAHVIGTATSDAGADGFAAKVAAACTTVSPKTTFRSGPE